jgi:hypothetical protein
VVRASVQTAKNPPLPKLGRLKAFYYLGVLGATHGSGSASRSLFTFGNLCGAGSHTGSTGSRSCGAGGGWTGLKAATRSATLTHVAPPAPAATAVATRRQAPPAGWDAGGSPVMAFGNESNSLIFVGPAGRGGRQSGTPQRRAGS